MSIPIEYILYTYANTIGREEIDLKELVDFLKKLWKDYRVAIFESINEMINHLKILENIGVIDLKEENKNLTIKINDLTYLEKISRVIENSYLTKIDTLYRDTLERIKECAKEIAEESPRPTPVEA